ncbi:nucleoside-diphosphate kinase [Streptomyces sp. NPDC002133]|uniref:nucleoside-diphosphate kinase n=1 Tax=Streptomyces sp. NPDC002133 TaxID=3154409 RepID=UPI00331D1520
MVDGVDWSRWTVILCKPDCVERGLVDQALDRIAAAGITVSGRLDLTAQAWQAHVHYWDLLVDADWFAGRDMPAALDALYVGKPVTVALGYAEPTQEEDGIQHRVRRILGHFDPTQARPGTIRGDLGDDSLDAALAGKRLVNNLVHTSDDPPSARRDFGTWFGANRRTLLAPQSAPRQRASTQS